jgi:hypothetical protein
MIRAEAPASSFRNGMGGTNIGGCGRQDTLPAGSDVVLSILDQHHLPIVVILPCSRRCRSCSPIPTAVEPGHSPAIWVAFSWLFGSMDELPFHYQTVGHRIGRPGIAPPDGCQAPRAARRAMDGGCLGVSETTLISSVQPRRSGQHQSTVWVIALPPNVLGPSYLAPRHREKRAAQALMPPLRQMNRSKDSGL